jgi:hypothetical protein
MDLAQYSEREWRATGKGHEFSCLYSPVGRSSPYIYSAPLKLKQSGWLATTHLGASYIAPMVAGPCPFGTLTPDVMVLTVPIPCRPGIAIVNDFVDREGDRQDGPELTPPLRLACGQRCGQLPAPRPSTLPAQRSALPLCWPSQVSSMEPCLGLFPSHRYTQTLCEYSPCVSCLQFPSPGAELLHRFAVRPCEAQRAPADLFLTCNV